jgi:hypothetical protein
MTERFDILSGRKAKDGKTYWTKLGAAFPNQSGGFSLVLDAMPASDGGQFRLVMMPVEAREDTQPRRSPTRSSLERSVQAPLSREGLHDEMDDEIPWLEPKRDR